MAKEKEDPEAQDPEQRDRMVSSDSELFADAIRSAAASQDDPTSAKVYLGDPLAVDTIVRMFVMDIISRLGEESDAAVKEIDDSISRLGRIFLGKDLKKHEPIPEWNAPGGVDRFLVEHSLAPMEQDAQGRMETFFFQLVGTVRDVVEFAGQEGVLKEQWDWQINAEIESYVNALLGIYIDPDEDMAATGPSLQEARMRTQESVLKRWGEYP